MTVPPKIHDVGVDTSGNFNFDPDVNSRESVKGAARSSCISVLCSQTYYKEALARNSHCGFSSRFCLSLRTNRASPPERTIENLCMLPKTQTRMHRLQRRSDTSRPVDIKRGFGMRYFDDTLVAISSYARPLLMICPWSSQRDIGLADLVRESWLSGA